ncbi:MAG TPA: hypothetical protein DCS87_07750 [Rheinheimera sp.]|nr:hypothetical protein [Rheinheimera sp.]
MNRKFCWVLPLILMLGGCGGGDSSSEASTATGATGGTGTGGTGSTGTGGSSGSGSGGTTTTPVEPAPVLKMGWLLPQSANDSINVLTVSLFKNDGSVWSGSIPTLQFTSSCSEQGQAQWLEAPIIDGHQVSQAYLAKGCAGPDRVQVSFNWQQSTVIQTISLPLTAAALSAKAQLGQQLFFSKALSASGVQSCATCHQPANRYASAVSSSTEVGGSTMQHSGFRNTPSATYSALIPRFGFLGVTNQQGTVDNIANGKLGTPRRGQLWDGRAALITTQAAGPLLSPFEMAHTDAASVLRTLLQLPQATLYRQVYGNLSGTSNAVTVLENVADAIGTFETEDRSFVPFNSKFDAVTAGTASFTAQEANGQALFNDGTKGACRGCHDSTGLSVDSPQLFSDLSYRVLAVPRNFNIVYNNDTTAGSALDKLGVASLRNGALIATSQHEFYDLGFCGPFRTDSLLDPTLCGAFRAAPLRNVAVRKSYFHNGIYHQLADVVRFYILRDVQPAQIYKTAQGAADNQYNDLPSEYHANIVANRNPFTPTPNGNPRLTPEEVNDLVTFLCTLTDGFDPTAPETYRQSPQCLAAKR